MSDDVEFALNVVLPDDLSDELQRLPIDGFRVEAVSAPDKDVTAKFGLAEAVMIIGVVKGVVDVVKVGLELSRLLKERARKKGDSGASASLSTPDGRRVVVITIDKQSAEVESEIRQAFAPAG